MTANPSQADGLEACTTAQIGLTTAVGETPIHFYKEPETCPDASKLGTLEVKTPLLGQNDEDGNVLQTDPERQRRSPGPCTAPSTWPSPSTTPSTRCSRSTSSIDDPSPGTIAKFAGRGQRRPPDRPADHPVQRKPPAAVRRRRPCTSSAAPGRSLITPPTCGTHTTTSTLTPWSSPEGADAHPSDSFQTTAAPGGGPAPPQRPRPPTPPPSAPAPLTPQARRLLPLRLEALPQRRLPRLTGIDTLLPPGLIGKLAGVGQCSEAQIAQAAASSKPEEGVLEQAQPLLPGLLAARHRQRRRRRRPDPLHTQGTAYLAGPYKGAPLSLAIITPAIAGPFDLGAVVGQRRPLRRPRDRPDPRRLRSPPDDPRRHPARPPLDRGRRSTAPTSPSTRPTATRWRSPASATSASAPLAPLTSRFQVGGCRGSALQAQALPEAQRRDQARLPPEADRRPHTPSPAKPTSPAPRSSCPSAAFLDQAHISTICTRVQFAADTCPAGSIYGKATATTPAARLRRSGPVYLRSSTTSCPTSWSN